MRSKRFYLSVTAAILLLFVVGAVLAQEATDPPAGNDEPTEDAVLDVVDSDGNVRLPIDRLGDVAGEKEGGFGGYYFSDDKDTVYVFMTDTTKTTEAREAFNAAYSGRHSPGSIVVVEGQYAFDTLVAWYYQLIPALSAEEIYPSTSAVMEDKNRIELGLKDESEFDDVRTVLADLEIPEDAVILVERGRIELLADGESLDEKWRPVVGGVQHEIASFGPECTIGFTTRRGGTDGIVVASHCTNTSRALGGLDNADIQQPTDPVWNDDNKVADETIDPSASAIDHSLCPSNFRCRYSDAAFAEMDDVSIDRGEIAKPDAVGSTEVDPAYETFDVNSDSGSFSVGDEVHYVGKRTGWRTGEVTHTCTDLVYRDPQGDTPGVKVICVGLT